MRCPACSHESVIFERQDHSSSLPVAHYKCPACGHCFSRTVMPTVIEIKEGEEIVFRTGSDTERQEQ